MQASRKALSTLVRITRPKRIVGRSRKADNCPLWYPVGGIYLRSIGLTVAKVFMSELICLYKAIEEELSNKKSFIIVEPSDHGRLKEEYTTISIFPS